MRILDKYILKELMGPFLFGIAAFSSVFIGTSTIFRIAQYMTKYGAALSSAIKLFIYSLPGIVILTFPMSMLLASLLAFGRLSAASEITAMKSGGISFYRLAAPVVMVAFCVSVFAVAFNEFVVPASNSAYNNVLRNEIERDSKPKAQEHIVIKDIQGGEIERLTYARSFDEQANIMRNVSIEEFDKGILVSVERAEYAVWQNTQWVMKNGTINDLTAEGNITRIMHFDEQILPTNKNPREIKREQKKAEEMTIKELKQHIAVLKREYVKTSVYEVELHQRLAIPVASLVFALIGTPMGLSPHRSSSSIGLGISILIIFVYYIFMAIGTALGQGGALPAVWAAWLPNIIGIVAGGILIRRASR